jgi:hypothetical protein
MNRNPLTALALLGVSLLLALAVFTQLGYTDYKYKASFYMPVGDSYSDYEMILMSKTLDKITFGPAGSFAINLPEGQYDYYIRVNYKSATSRSTILHASGRFYLSDKTPSVAVRPVFAPAEAVSEGQLGFTPLSEPTATTQAPTVYTPPVVGSTSLTPVLKSTTTTGKFIIRQFQR